MPDATQWAELDHLLDHGAAQWMIWEAEPMPEIREALAERGLDIIVVSPCSTPPPSGDFFDVMRGNAAAIRAAFQSAS
jgi:hypothetical protein